ncbi:hypothetical protein CC80DRAFT_511099 [Byssothecium circinans]|uniref:Uncharacterized protein n=1 Tax=Byssothecium circinans TaxID=147558 RepID=A0A6A5T966_9PLEO|nr:hypothetical protein CC80DRAFT_511099 [Byssothecium circinans]
MNQFGHDWGSRFLHGHTLRCDEAEDWELVQPNDANAPQGTHSLSTQPEPNFPVTLMILPLEVREEILEYVMADLPIDFNISKHTARAPLLNPMWPLKITDAKEAIQEVQKLHTTYLKRVLPPEVRLNRQMLTKASLVWLRNRRIVMTNMKGTRAFIFFLSTFQSDQGFRSVHHMDVRESLSRYLNEAHDADYDNWFGEFVGSLPALETIHIVVYQSEFENSYRPNLSLAKAEGFQFLRLLDCRLLLPLSVTCAWESLSFDPDVAADAFRPLITWLEDEIKRSGAQIKIDWKVDNDYFVDPTQREQYMRNLM